MKDAGDSHDSVFPNPEMQIFCLDEHTASSKFVVITSGSILEVQEFLHGNVTHILCVIKNGPHANLSPL